MYGSNIIFGGGKEERFEKLMEIISGVEPKLTKKNFKSNPDVRVIELAEDKKSLGIAEVKLGADFLQEKPFKLKQKFLIFLDAEKMTREAQNSLLKTLEEPPAYAQIFLLTKTQNSILETVLSRCRRIPLTTSEEITGSKEFSDQYGTYEKVVKKTVGERLGIAEDLAKEEKDDIVLVLETWASQARKHLLNQNEALPAAENLENILNIKRDLENFNVNTRMALETLVIQLKNH